MSDLAKRIADLSPEKRALLTLRLKHKQQTETQAHTIQRRPDTETYPLSFAQQRLWFMDQLDGGSPVYNIPATVRLSGVLDVAALRASLNALVQRHEVLRATFATTKGGPVQRIASELLVELPLIDLQTIAEREREHELWRLATLEAQQPFDLQRGPLVRARLLRVTETEHVLLLTLHHIVADGWSIGVIVREVAALYAAQVSHADAPLPEMPIQYADFAHWQREQIAGDLRANQIAYWKQQLGPEGTPSLAVLELPTDRPRPPVQTSHGAHHAIELPAEVVEALKRLAQREEATAFMALLAAFQVLLQRYSGQDDIAVGTPITNRTRTETEALIGCLVNTVVLRSQVSERLSFRQLLQQVRATTLGAFDHQDIPFEILVDELQPQRDLSHTPLFQAMFVLQSAPIQSTNVADLTLSLLETESGTAKFDLMLMIEEGAGTRAIWEYNTDLFDAATIERMAAHFGVLLAAIVAAPDQPVATLPLLSAAEQHEIVREWNNTAVEFAAPLLLHALIEAQVTRTPDAVAVTFADQQLSYAELNARANQLAHTLIARGVGPETLVGICAERSVELVVGLLGILKAGGAYVPLDPHYPAERLAFMIQDAAVPVLLTQAHLVAQLPPHAAHIIALDADWSQIAQQPASNVSSAVTAHNLAYMIYTSGSTGQPKGALNTHGGIVNRLMWMQQQYGLTAADRVLQKTPFSFDVSVWEFFWPLMTGARLVVAKPEGHKDSAYLVDLINEAGITTLHFVPPMLQVFLESEAVTTCRSLRRVLCSGEALPFELQQRFFSRLDAELHNLYGPTEAAVDVTFWQCRRDTQRSLVPIGRPVANTQIYILDAQMQPVPLGVAGELYIGGVQVGRGYLNRPALTAERFVPDPFSTQTGARLYRTGDLARYLADGVIEFLGRIDHQTKVRGFRIELGEIEAVLNQHPSVREAVVLARTDRPGDTRLVAYVVEDGEPRTKNQEPEGAESRTENHELKRRDEGTNEQRNQEPGDTADGSQFLVLGSSTGSSDLRTFLTTKLPDYMIPAIFVTLPALPLSPNGKVDRRALPAPDGSRPDLRAAYVAPRTAIEQYLADMWRDMLSLERVGVYDNFFELGGDSIRAAILTNRLQEELGVDAHVRSIFYAPTVADLSMYVQEYFPQIVAEKFPSTAADSLKDKLEAEIAATEQRAKIDESQVALIRQLMPPLTPHSRRAAKNAPAVFILSPPRSGSTLLRVMLAGHPQLFSPPELELLTFDTMSERRAALSGIYEPMLEGTIRALMEASGVDTERATELLAEYEREGVTTHEFYRILQDWLGERMLVDKTPSYSMDPAVLARAEQEFEQPRYIHLVRHPYATIYSFVEARLHEFFFRHPHPFSIQELAELIWLNSHRNIQTFLQTIPSERHFMLRYEDVVSQPQATMEQVCQFLGMPFHPDMIKPYQGTRMTDGIRPMSQMVGDLKFYLRKDIDAKAADRWKKFHAADFLSDLSWQVAETLGYERPDEPTSDNGAQRTQAKQPPLEPIGRDGELPLSFAQRRLWFLDQLEPGNAFYNMPTALRLQGQLDVAALQHSIQRIVQRHEILRTTFATVDGQPQQRIAPELVLPMPLIDLAALPTDQREAEVQRLAIAEAQRPFDLERGPLLRTTLLRLQDDEHVALITMHHIVGDGWSGNVIIRELAALYTASVQHTAAPLPPLPVQYVDYAHWQRTWLAPGVAGGVLEQQLAYWQQHLGDAMPVLALPTDRPRPAVQTAQGARHAFALPQSLSEQLVALSRRENVTLFMTLLAALDVLLHRYSGQDDISVGTPTANRTRAEVEGLVGCFVNTLVLRTDLAGDPSFRELLGRVRDVAVGAYAHQDVPFEMLVDQLQPERNLSYTPLFQVMFVLQNAPLQSLTLPGLTLSPIAADNGTAKFDLTLQLVERTDGLRGSLEYNTDLFDAATIERMVAQWATLLQAIVVNPDRRIAALPLLTAAEQRELLALHGRTVDYPYERTLHRWFETQAAQTPTAVAVTYEDQRLTYAELNERANQLAHYLRKQGIGLPRADGTPATPLVGMWVERSLDLIVGVLGILKAGGAYLPIDLTYPAERIQFMLDDAQASVLLTQAHLVAQLPRTSAQPVLLDGHWPAIAQGPSTNLAHTTQPDDLAYVIYTSGSTGQPKGVQVTHANVARLFTATEHWFGFGERDVWTLFHSYAFDFSVWELWGALLYGGRLVVVPYWVSRAPDAFYAILQREQVTVLNQTPSAFRQLIHAEASAERAAELALRYVIFGGEALDLPSLQPWFARHGDQRPQLVNMYGITETTVHVTYRPLSVADAEAATGSVIGGPIGDLRLYVLDAQMQPVPLGVPGELYVAGAGLARGYLNRPALTAERFVPDPFGTQPGARLYRSGDLARLRPGGDIEYLGRIDQQVKVRGFRIELGEIEAVLAQHPAVRDVVVIARAEQADEKRLVAYLVPTGDELPGVAELRSHVQQHLPDYMTPAAFVSLPALPLTTNGKVDRKALPAPISERSVEAELVVPRTAAEQTLAEVWAQVLGVSQIGVHDNFFELGGDSILGIQVIARATQAGLRITPKQLFQYPTVAGLAAVATTTPLVQAEQGLVTGAVPLTPIQRWFFEQALPTPQHWNQAVLLSTQQRIDQQHLRQTIAHLLCHHDALRLRFTASEQGWQQTHDTLTEDVPVAWIDLSAVPEAEQRAAIERASAELQHSLHLAQGPLLRVAALDAGPERAGRLLIVVHHLAIDGVSWRILLEDFQTIYAQVSRGEAIELPAKTTSYQHWARRLVEYAQTPTVQAELDYWLGLGDSPRLPLDHQNGDNSEASAESVITTLSAEQTQALLHDVPAAYGSEINDTLLTALVQATTAWTGAPTLRIELEGHGREDLFDDVDLSRTVGWFTTIYPVRLDLSAASEPGAALKTIKEQLRRVPNRGIGYGLLRYLSADATITDRLRALPPAEIVFNYLGQYDQMLVNAPGFGLAHESSGPDHAPDGRRSHVLSINGGIVGGRLRLEWSYSTQLHQRATIEQLAERFTSALEALIAHCQRPDAAGYTPSDFPDAGLSQADIDALLAEVGEIE